jgi:hypothetical protein
MFRRLYLDDAEHGWHLVRSGSGFAHLVVRGQVSIFMCTIIAFTIGLEESVQLMQRRIDEATQKLVDKVGRSKDPRHACDPLGPWKLR